MGELKHSDITGTVIKSFYKVYNALGYGFAEKVYENALLIELKQNGLEVKSQNPIKVYYEGNLVGDYYADLVVENIVIIELKAAESISGAHEAQLCKLSQSDKNRNRTFVKLRSKARLSKKVFNQ